MAQIVYEGSRKKNRYNGMKYSSVWSTASYSLFRNQLCLVEKVGLKLFT